MYTYMIGQCLTLQLSTRKKQQKKKKYDATRFPTEVLRSLSRSFLWQWSATLPNAPRLYLILSAPFSRRPSTPGEEKEREMGPATDLPSPLSLGGECVCVRGSLSPSSIVFPLWVLPRQATGLRQSSSGRPMEAEEYGRRGFPCWGGGGYRGGPRCGGAKIYPDPDAEVAIMGSMVYCIHYKEGCKWSDELRKLQGHLNMCKFDAIPCTNHCGAMIPRLLMEDHLLYTCPKRRTRCEYCSRDFTGETLESHVGSCQLEPIYCENKCGSKIQRRHHSNHRLHECNKRLVPCRYCQKEFVFDTLQIHLSKCPRLPVSCPNRCEVPKIAKEDLETHLSEHCSALTLSCAFKDVGCKFKGSRSAMDQHLEDASKSHLNLVCGLVSRQQHQITALRAALQGLTLNTSGTLLWKIGDYSRRVAEAREGYELCSAPFYTSQHGYKLMATLFLNGNGAGEGTHLSIYIKLLPGDYDALLPWPFSHTVTFVLYDQQGGDNVVESFVPDPTWKNFQRPSKEPDALGFGFPRFVSHEVLNKRNYVKDDVMFIKVKVDASKIIAV